MKRWAVWIATASAAMACSSSPAPPPAKPCNEDPWECPAGRTCWPVSQTAFGCVVSGTGKAGDACDDVTNAPSCGDGLVCLAPMSTGGVCTPYCDATDPGRGCPAGQTCLTVHLVSSQGLTFQACAGPAAPAGDAGPASDASSTSSD